MSGDKAELLTRDDSQSEQAITYFNGVESKIEVTRSVTKIIESVIQNSDELLFPYLIVGDNSNYMDYFRNSIYM